MIVSNPQWVEGVMIKAPDNTIKVPEGAWDETGGSREILSRKLDESLRCHMPGAVYGDSKSTSAAAGPEKSGAVKRARRLGQKRRKLTQASRIRGECLRYGE